MVHLNPTLRANHLVISSHLLTIQCQDSTQGNLLASMAQGLSHPDQLFQKLVHATDKGFIEQLAIFVENFLYARETHVPENRHQPQLSHHRKQVLDHPGATEWSGGNADDSDCLVNVFLEATVEDVLQQAGVAVIVFRS